MSFIWTAKGTFKPTRTTSASVRTLCRRTHTAPAENGTGARTARTDDGFAIAYEHIRGGEDTQSPQFLFAHATGFCRQVWRPVISALKSAHSAVIVDLRGHGDSSALRKLSGEIDGNWWQFGNDIVAVARHVANGGARTSARVGVGHSLGGAAVLMAQLRDPSLFDALVLVEPVVFMPPYERRSDYVYATAAARRRSVFPSRSAALANFASKDIFRKWDARCLEEYVRGGVAMTGRGDEVALKCSPDGEAEIYRMSWHNLWEFVPEIGVPTLLIAASESFTHPEPYATALSRRIRAGKGGVSRFVTIPGASHLVPMERPETVAAEIAAFMSQ